MNNISKISICLIFLLASISTYAKHSPKPDGLYAELNTTKGNITVALFAEQMPISVANFVSLAEGKRKKELDPQFRKKAFYNESEVQGTLAGYSIQTQNFFVKDENEGIGYSLPIEQNDSLSMLHNLLCVSSSNVDNNGSRLVFSVVPFPFINDANTPIGQVVEGVEVLNALEQHDVIHTVKIVRVGKKAKKTNHEQIVTAALALQKEEELKFKDTEQERMLSDLTSLIDNNDEVYRFFAKAKLEAFEKGEVLSDGIRLIKWKTTDGPLPKKGEKIWVSFVGYLPNGRLFDSSYDNSEAMRFTFGSGEQIKAWDKIFEHIRLGEKATVIVPSSMAYGAKGADRTIPPYTTLIFDVTLEEIEE